MKTIEVLKHVDKTLRQIGAGGMRVAANGPSIGEVVSRALQPGATDAVVKNAFVLAGKVFDQYRAAPEHIELVTEARSMLRLAD